MIYLLDANTLIHAKNFYYPIERVPEFWEWLVHQGNQGSIKIPLEIYEEFHDTQTKDGKEDELSVWSKDLRVKQSLLFTEEVDQEILEHVTYNGYVAAPTDEDLVRMGRDPFLIAYALRDHRNRCVVTTEVSKPGRVGANRHVPDVCKTLGVRCINSFQLIQELDFRTTWKPSARYMDPVNNSGAKGNGGDK